MLLGDLVKIEDYETVMVVSNGRIIGVSEFAKQVQGSIPEYFQFTTFRTLALGYKLPASDINDYNDAVLYPLDGGILVFAKQSCLKIIEKVSTCPFCGAKQ